MRPPSLQIPAQTIIGYGRTQVARALEDIHLEEGNHFLLARNGRGKTTLLRTIAGNLPALEGKPLVHGRVQYLCDDLAFDHELPGRSILKAMLGKQAFPQAMALAEKAELDTSKPFGRLSKGNKQKVLLILAEYRAHPGEASVLLLDEPFTGLDTVARECFLGVWAARTEGILRLITAHPDYDAMDMRRPVLITSGEIRLAKRDEGHVWGDLKQHLN